MQHRICTLFGRIVAMNDLLKSIEAPVNPNIPELRPGDSVSVHVKIKEGNRERIQEFKGTILYLHNDGTNSTQPRAVAVELEVPPGGIGFVTGGGVAGV